VREDRGLGRVTAPTMADSVADAIRTAIVSGRFTPGERLVEAELSRRLGVSRGPVREALALLERDGLVVNVPRHGKFVPELTPQLIDETYGLRRVLEPYAAELVIARLDSRSVRRLEAGVSAIGRAARSNDVVAVANMDIAFHDLLYELPGHALLWRVWHENVANKLRILLNVTNKTLAALADAEHAHRLLLEPILARDVKAASNRLVSHIDDAWQRARATLDGGASN
jgi:DNA-binding GntR family transcriptional regulator